MGTLFLFVYIYVISCEFLSSRVVEMISTLVRRLSPTPSGAALMSVAVNILAKMLKW